MVRTFVNDTMYPQYNNNIYIIYININYTCIIYKVYKYVYYIHNKHKKACLCFLKQRESRGEGTKYLLHLL
jgi:hypothetical protein